MTTLANLRALLEMTPDGPARQRAGGTVEGMARMYLARWFAITGGYNLLGTRALTEDLESLLDLADAAASHALLTALALALGLDPGLGALALSWTRRTVGDSYILCTPMGNWLFDVIEPDPVKALELAVARVLEVARAHP